LCEDARLKANAKDQCDENFHVDLCF
jgi:hypothetical protein